jgi:hypothetical protein
MPAHDEFEQSEAKTRQKTLARSHQAENKRRNNAPANRPASKFISK